MKLSAKEMLARLGAGERIAAVCRAAGIGREEFDAWWQTEAASRAGQTDGVCRASVRDAAQIERDQWGIPHIFAANDDDLFFAFGFAMAEDRLFQLDYLRRKALGRLSEILGPEALELDVLSRTVGLGRIAEQEAGALPEETRRLLAAFSAGVNARVEQAGDRLPIEFDLLAYRPEPWSPLDCLAIAVEFRWYLTGRFPVIVLPELAKRILGQGALLAAFLQGEADDESILPPGSYSPARGAGGPLCASGGGPDEGEGSNNWVVSGRRARGGKPLLASDPHIAFSAVSCWYEVRLCGGSFHVAGMTYAGIPAVMFGRNERVGWGSTNNICSQRDLYQEQTDAARPGSFLFAGRWEPARELEEVIQVRGREPVRKTIRFSRNGPIVDEILPEPARGTGPVALRWLGAEPCGWLTALLAMDRARSADEFREATRPWMVPTWNVVFCDVEGRIGYQCTGRIPLRKVPERGYRLGWDPEHQWEGLIPFEGMPRLADPDRGYVITANNRTAPDDFAYPLAGAWISGHRALRIRQMIEERSPLLLEDLTEMHEDVLSLRAVENVPRLLGVLDMSGDGRVAQAAGRLREWDCRMEPDRVAAAIFNVFFSHWCQVVADERFDGELAVMAAAACGGLAAGLLADDPAGWFAAGRREQAIRQAFEAALDTLTERFGADMSRWGWGNLHRITLGHVLARRGELAGLLDCPALAVKGDMVTVSSTGSDADWQATTGAGYRLMMDMASSPPELWAIDAGSQSGQPGSPHYADQLPEWIRGRYHCLPLDRARVSEIARSRLRFEPAER